MERTGKTVRYFSIAIFVLLLVFVFVFVYLIWFANLLAVDQDKMTSETDNLFTAELEKTFYQPIGEETGLALLSPLTATIYERYNATKSVDQDVALTETFLPADLDVDLRQRLLDYKAATSTEASYSYVYAERLVVVKPYNWFIYTPNGTRFYYITSNVNRTRSRCDPASQLNAIEYRLMTQQESVSGKADRSGRLKFSCLNYTYDNLVRIFGSSSYRSVYDISAYFDKEKNIKAPDLTVDEVLDLLLTNRAL